ncbi:type III-B CRISPR module-associated Cmr3 family protein, partial [Microbacterium sp.]|uniref:type III-B CRISPR module-associated Cmr3 family protein n=1 Tax=Microbacterium sp. TaxID=51671 RepID=UPI003A8AED2B
MTWWALSPDDTVHVRDGRAFAAATNGVAHAVMPHPSTVGGAVSAAMGGARFTSLRGPYVGMEARGCWVPYFPVPRDLMRRRGDLVRLAPSNADHPMRTSPITGQRLRLADPNAEPLPDQLVSGTRLAKHLKTTSVGPLGSLPPDEIFKAERRVGLARTDGTARRGFL